MEKRFIGVKDLSEYLSISRHTVYYWVQIRKIPYVKMGKIVRFDLREIEAWIKERKVKVID